jgi:hypothetical protein
MVDAISQGVDGTAVFLTVVPSPGPWEFKDRWAELIDDLIHIRRRSDLQPGSPHPDISTATLDEAIVRRVIIKVGVLCGTRYEKGSG